MSSSTPVQKIVNRKAAFHYFISETWEAGIVLTGTEIKSIREGKANLSDAYCLFRDSSLWLKNMHISAYEHGGYSNHEPKRERKLLLHRYQLRRIHAKLKERGITLIPVSLYINERGYAKVELGLARGKKLYDKRESIKTAESKRELGRIMKRSR